MNEIIHKYTNLTVFNKHKAIKFIKYLFELEGYPEPKVFKIKSEIKGENEIEYFPKLYKNLGNIKGKNEDYNNNLQYIYNIVYKNIKQFYEYVPIKFCHVLTMSMYPVWATYEYAIKHGFENEIISEFLKYANHGVKLAIARNNGEIYLVTI